MAVQLTIPYETLIDLVEQLPDAEQVKLLNHLALGNQRPSTAEAWIRQFEAAVLHVEVNEAPSIRREDWYDDDGR